MKKKYKRFGKSFISIMLTILMLVSSMMLGSIATIEASAESVEFSSGSIMYIAPTNGGFDWTGDNAEIAIYFFGTSGSAWSELIQDTGYTDSKSRSIYYAEIPAGTWDHLIIVRMDPNGTGSNWDKKWNQTGNIEIQSGSNYLKYFLGNSTTTSWDTFQPSATVTLTAPTSQTVTTGASVTCTSTNTVNSTYSTGTTAYKVYNSAGTSEVGSSVASVSGSTITFNTAGTYQVKAALTYTANGFSSISDTVYSDAATITVEDPSGPVTGIRVAAKYGSDGSTFGTLTTEPSVTITGDNSATANLSGGTVSITGSGTVSAAESFQISGTTYAFTKWTSSGSGTFADDSNNETTFNARTENEIVTANYTKCYNVNVTQTSGGRISVDRNLVQAGGSFTVTAVPDATTANGSDYANIDYITVWCYNYPKTYNVHLYMPNPEEEYVTTGENINVENATSNSTVWDIDADGVIVVKDEGGSPFAKSISGYYNMRIGGAETGGTAEQNAAIDGASDYLTAYGLSNAVTEAYTPPMNQIPVKVDVKDSEGIITGQEIKAYQFKGWYIDNNGTKVLLSTDRYYKNRITRDLDLFAGYEPTTATASTLPGVAVTNGGKDETITYYNKGSEEDPEWTTTVIAEADQANVTISGVDYYYDEKGIKRVRFNTQMNVYDSKDSNENIKKAAVLYLQLPVTDDMGNQITWTQSDLDALHLTDYESNVEGAVGPQIKTFIDAMSTELTAGSSYYAKSSSPAITITRDGTTYNAKLIAYNYIVKWSTTEAGYDANDCAVLTTKNRIEYVLPMRADYYEGVDAGSEHIPGSNSAVITYAAIYYDDSTDEIDAQWIESDNYVAYTHDLMPG